MENDSTSPDRQYEEPFIPWAAEYLAKKTGRGIRQIGRFAFDAAATALERKMGPVAADFEALCEECLSFEEKDGITPVDTREMYIDLQNNTGYFLCTDEDHTEEYRAENADKIYRSTDSISHVDFYPLSSMELSQTALDWLLHDKHSKATVFPVIPGGLRTFEEIKDFLNNDPMLNQKIVSDELIQIMEKIRAPI